MGLRLEVLKWEDTSGGRQIVARMPESGMADIKLGARCIVQESQAAVFFRNGKAMDTLKAGAHTLTTENLPVVSSLFKLVYNDAPFQSCVYFVSLKPFRELKWGTKEPILLEDTKFGFVNVRAFGSFSIRVTDPGMFIQTVVGTEGRQDSQDIERWFKDVVCARFADLVAEYMQGKSVVQLQAKRDELAVATKARTADDFAKYGIELYDFLVSSISLPDAVKQAVDQRGAMGALGLAPGGQGYMQMAAADALRNASQNQGGAGGMMGAGMGLAAGMMMPGMMGQAMGMGHPGMGHPGMGHPGYGYGAPGMAAPPPMAPPPPLPGGAPFHVALNGAQQGPFDVNAIRGLAGQGQVTPATLVWRPGMAAWTPAKDVPDLAAVFAPAGPPPLPTAGGPPPMPPPLG
ncbi:MAG: SPFH domain-containing protein [Planctomycetes bacterium]|nr:SPFH domain-containing protein [Planctomycetota bacterium]